jgi:DNA-binding NarL/FixJ family response regulator
MKKTTVLVATHEEKDWEFFISSIPNQENLRFIGIEKDEVGTVIKTGQYKPDILVFDIRLPGIDGAVLAPLIHRRSPKTSIILMSDRDENEYAGRALASGVSGFMLKGKDMDKLLEVIKIVSKGGYYISASITRKVLEKINIIKPSPDQENLPFSAAERSIISSIAMGFTDKEIARQLNYSTGTVKNCLVEVKRKTKLKNRVQIALYAFVYGFVRLEEMGFLKEM